MATVRSSPPTSSIGLAAAATTLGEPIRLVQRRGRRAAPTGADEPNAARISPRSRSTASASEQTAMTIALRGPTFMKVWGWRVGSTSTETISSSGSRALRFTPTRKSSSRMRRSPRTLATSISALSTRRGGSASPAGEAVPRFPPSVPRLRICGEPTVREASASAGSASAISPRIASAYVSPAPSLTVPFSRDQLRSSPTSLRFSTSSGRNRSKFSPTMRSVPPWIGTASGWSALSRSASSSERGVRTSMCVVF